MRNNIIIVQQCKLQYVKFHVVANSPSFSLNKSSIQCSYSCSTHIEQKDHILCQVVAYKRFKRMENYLNCQPKMGSQLHTGIDYLQEVPTVRF